MKHRDIRTLSHSFYDCKYHIVFTPKYRGKILKGQVAKEIRRILRLVCKWKGFEILEGNICSDHHHPFRSIQFRMQCLSSRVRVRRGSRRRIRNIRSYADKGSLWAGYFVSTVGVDEEVIRRCKAPEQA